MVETSAAASARVDVVSTLMVTRLLAGHRLTMLRDGRAVWAAGRSCVALAGVGFGLLEQHEAVEERRRSRLRPGTTACSRCSRPPIRARPRTVRAPGRYIARSAMIGMHRRDVDAERAVDERRDARRRTCVRRVLAATVTGDVDDAAALEQEADGHRGVGGVVVGQQHEGVEEALRAFGEQPPRRRRDGGAAVAAVAAWRPRSSSARPRAARRWSSGPPSTAALATMLSTLNCSGASAANAGGDRDGAAALGQELHRRAARRRRPDSPA